MTKTMIESNQQRIIELHETKKNGVVYTPMILADYVAEKVLGYFFAEVNLETDTLKNIRIMDPACGEGELLISIWTSLSKHLSPASENSQNPALLDARQILCGIDIDQRAINRTKERIASLSHESSNSDKFNLLKTNALFPLNKASASEGWQTIKQRFQAIHGFDIVIANPPWGASVESYQSKLANGEFSLYKGQFDTSDLFIELALSIVKPSGYFAFIVSDSLFNMERTKLRSMLLEQTEIKYIGRFGEKIFDGINRACVVIICKKSNSTPSTRVDCLRLTPQFRKGILQGELTFEDAERSLVHSVAQSRFANNPDYLFDIYVRQNEEEILAMLRSSQSTLRDYLSNYRGVELSKSGKICKCNICGLWLPYPSAKDPKCAHCKSTLSLSEIETANIIADQPIDGYERLLVGENIRRYKIDSSCWIATDKHGINYKDPSIYEGPKILIRKTGVGLSATIDYQNSLTNQVVYIFKSKSAVMHPVPLELFLAVINSRAIYYYLVKSHGETEWRSHPYLTQNQILDLPLPIVTLEAGTGLAAASQITELLKPYLIEGKELPPKVDAKVEYLVSSLFGLSRKQYQRIYDTLGDVEELLPIKCLKTVSLSDIFSS